MDKRKFPSDHFAAFAFSSADILFEVDEAGVIVFAEGAIAVLLGRGLDVVGTALSDIVPEGQRKRLANIYDSLERLLRIDSVSLTLLHKDGTLIPFNLSGIYVDHKHGRYYISMRSESQMQSPNDLDERDPTSGLFEKNSFAIHASKKIAEATAKGEEVEVTVLDFPGLGGMLDAMGSEQAKLLLRVIGDYIKEHSVDGDTAAMVDRSSYSILTPAKLDTKELTEGIIDVAKREVSEKINLQVDAHKVRTDSEEYPLSQQDTANAILYTMNKFASDKGEGFDITSLNDSYEEMLDSTLECITEFRRTLMSEDFTIAYQPIVNIRDGIVHHYECLVRLKNSEKFSNPFEFITFGEQSGLINEFDLAITEKVLNIIREQQKSGNRVFLAINLSGRSLGSNLFMDSFLNILRDHEDVRSRLIVEVTESYKISDMVVANDFIQTLRTEGNYVCLDDFGSGESSFDYLRHLQVDYIKIDGSYVRDSMKTQRGRTLLKAMASLCASLDMRTIGEMVETEQEAEFLNECGVRYGQGYLIGKPDTDSNILKMQDKVGATYSGLFNVRRFRQQQDD